MRQLRLLALLAAAPLVPGELRLILPESRARDLPLVPDGATLCRYIGAIAVMLVLWEAAALVLATPALPGPASGIGQLVAQAGVIWPQFLVSAWRVVASIGLGLLVGGPVGLLLGRARRADALFGPLVFLNYPIPKVVFFPILLVLLGIGNVFGGENLLHGTGFFFVFYFMELLVGLIQSIVFTLLTSVYIGLICNHGDDHDHESGHAVEAPH